MGVTPKILAAVAVVVGFALLIGGVAAKDISAACILAGVLLLLGGLLANLPTSGK